MTNIVNTTVGSVIPRGNFNGISKKRKSINTIKEEVYNLLDVEEQVRDFRRTYTERLKTHSQFFSLLNEAEKKMINKSLADLKFLTKEVEIKSLINNNLEGLGCYLARLKVTLLTKDVKVSKRIMHKFTKQKDMNLTHIMEEIVDFNRKLDLLEKSYLKFVDVVNAITNSLEHKVLLNHEGVYKIEELRKLSVKQKELLYHIGKNFCEISRDLLNDKECRKKLKKC